MQAVRFYFSSEALVGKPRKHTGSSLEWIRETSRQRERQSRRLTFRRQGRALERVAMSFSGGLPGPGMEPGSPASQADS